MKKIIIIIITMGTVTVLQNCSGTGKLGGNKHKVTYNHDIAPILKNSCTPCHFPAEGRKEPLNTYETAKNKFAEILVRVKLPQSDAKFMPYKNKKPALSDSLINILQQWQNQNMPE